MLYDKWIEFATTNEQNLAFLEHLVSLRNDGKESEKLLQTYAQSGIIGSPTVDGDFFQDFLDFAEVTLEDLGYVDTPLNRFGDGFIIPSWGTGKNLLFCVNHNKERQSGIDAKYINLYPTGKKEILSNFRFYGLDSTEDALKKGYMCVCEGIFDRLRLLSEGHPSMTTLGSQISKTQLRILNRFDMTYIIGDNDLAGRKSQEKIMKGTVRTKQLLIPYEKDIDDLAKLKVNIFNDFITQIK